MEQRTGFIILDGAGLDVGTLLSIVEMKLRSRRPYQERLDFSLVVLFYNDIEREIDKLKRLCSLSGS